MNQVCVCCGKPAVTTVEHIRVLQTTTQRVDSGYRTTETSALIPVPYCQLCSRHAWGAERKRRSETVRFDAPAWGAGIVAWIIGFFVLRFAIGLSLHLIGSAVDKSSMGPVYMVSLGFFAFSVIAVFTGLPRKLGGFLLAALSARHRGPDCSFQNDEEGKIEALVRSHGT